MNRETDDFYIEYATKNKGPADPDRETRLAKLEDDRQRLRIKILTSKGIAKRLAQKELHKKDIEFSKLWSGNNKH